MNEIPVLIVGTGHGCRVHLPALRSAGFNVVGLVGGTLERTKKRAEKVGVPRAFTDLEEAIKTTGARAVTIASPPHTHAEMVLTAVGQGCHVMCEKPFTRDAAEARKLLQAAEKADVIHLIGNQMRANPERVVIARAIASGMIGEPKFLTMIQHVGLVISRATWPEWWTDKNAGGGWLGASGSHMIDQVRSWLGDFSSLSAALPVVSGRENVAEDSFAVRFSMANGVEGLIQQTGAAYGPYASMTRLNGTKGTLWLDDKGSPWLADAEGERQLEVPEELILPYIEPSDDPRKPFIHIELPPTIRLFEAWRDAINLKAGIDGRFATFTDGVAAMEVIDAIRQSAATDGQLVAVKE